MKTTRVLRVLIASLGLVNGLPGAPPYGGPPGVSIVVGGDGQVQASATVAVSAAVLSPPAIISFNSAAGLTVDGNGESKASATIAVSAAVLSPPTIISFGSATDLTVDGNGESNVSGVHPLDGGHVAIVRDVAAPETTSTFLGNPGIFKAAQTTSTFLGSPGIFKEAQTTSTFLGSPGIFKPQQADITFKPGCPPFHGPGADAAATPPNCPGVFKRVAETTSTFLGSPGIFKEARTTSTFLGNPGIFKPHEDDTAWNCPAAGADTANRPPQCTGMPQRPAETTSTFLGSPGIFKAAPTAAPGVFPPAKYYWLTGSSSGYSTTRNVTSSGTVKPIITHASGVSPAPPTAIQVLTTSSGADVPSASTPLPAELTTQPFSTITESATRTTTQLVGLNPSYKAVSLPPCPNDITVTITVIATDVVAGTLPSVGIKNSNITVTKTGLPIFTGSFVTSQKSPSNDTSVTIPTPTGPALTGAVGATDVNLAFLVGFMALTLLF